MFGGRRPAASSQRPTVGTHSQSLETFGGPQSTEEVGMARLNIEGNLLAPYNAKWPLIFGTHMMWNYLLKWLFRYRPEKSVGNQRLGN